ncbi:hypothetical protein RHGRI_032194 [Rhododendron griersonianum]|uniref:Uncharacterized protein n=1 Tax=Rhododendron griersonianum TaxID=479676 RepID=A0AAV6IE14_9ERIC|nr:hypothetical protein RHGRI_032194 [Rhododendron griersonianum]
MSAHISKQHNRVHPNSIIYTPVALHDSNQGSKDSSSVSSDLPAYKNFGPPIPTFPRHKPIANTVLYKPTPGCMSNIDTDPQYLIQNNAETSPKIHHFQQIMFNMDDETYPRRNATHFVQDSRCNISHLKPWPNIVGYICYLFAMLALKFMNENGLKHVTFSTADGALEAAPAVTANMRETSAKEVAE